MGRSLIACLLLGTSLSASAVTWYVRPSTAEYGAEDGTSFATAYDGVDDIDWTTDVDAGDTVILCGGTAGFQAEDMVVADSGSSGSPITITGDCSASETNAASWQAPQGLTADPVTVTGAVMDGNTTAGIAISLTNRDFITIKRLKIQNYDTAAIHVEGNTSGPAYADNDIIEYVFTYANGDWGDSAARDISCSTFCRGIIVRYSRLVGDGSARGVDGFLVNCSDAGCGSTGTVTNGTGSGHLIYGNYIYGHQENEVDFKFNRESSSSEGWAVAYDNDLHGISNAAQAIVDIHRGSQKVRITRNYIHGGLVGVRFIQESLDTTNNEVVANLIHNIQRAGIEGGATNGVSDATVMANNTISLTGQGTAPPHCGIRTASDNTTIVNNILDRNCSGVTSSSGRYQLELKASLASMAGETINGNIYLQDPGATTTIISNNGSNLTISGAQSAGIEALGQNADPKFIEPRPTATSPMHSFRLASNSPAIRAGIYHNAARRDILGRAIGLPQTIGAFARGDGDPAAARTAATSRQAR